LDIDELKQQYRELERRYKSLIEGEEKNRMEIVRLAAENSVLKTDVIRLGAELSAAQQNVQLLGNDYNDRSRAKDREIGKLRSRLRENGLDTEVN
jgi:hypothetical protein